MEEDSLTFPEEYVVEIPEKQMKDGQDKENVTCCVTYAQRNCLLYGGTFAKLTTEKG